MPDRSMAYNRSEMYISDVFLYNDISNLHMQMTADTNHFLYFNWSVRSGRFGRRDLSRNQSEFVSASTDMKRTMSTIQRKSKDNAPFDLISQGNHYQHQIKVRNAIKSHLDVRC